MYFLNPLSYSKNQKRARLGQVFLNDVSIAQDIVRCAGVCEDDSVIEIGPGKGVLTGLLAEKVKKVYAIEKDQQLCLPLGQSFNQYNNLSFICADALQFRYEKIKTKFKLVSNLPYCSATPILLQLLHHKEKCISATVMVQKEVAERITAKPGGKDYGRLSLAVQLWCKVKLLFYVNKEYFSPVPKVDSAVIKLNILKERCVHLKSEDVFFRIVQTAFSQRRKTLRNNLKGLECLEGTLDDLFKACRIDPSRRAETVSIEEFAMISNYVAAHVGKPT